MTDGNERKNPELPEDKDFDELEAKATELRERAASTGPTRMPEVPEWNYKRPRNAATNDDPNNYKGLGIGISVAYMMLGSLVVGLGIGWLLDKAFNQTIFLAIFGLIGALFGIATTFILINRSQLNK